MTKNILPIIALVIGCAVEGNSPSNFRPEERPELAAGPHQREVDAYMQPVLEDGWLASAAVLLVTPEGSEFYGFGSTDLEQVSAPTPHTPYEIGSISKVFAGLLLADEVVRGNLTLDQPLAEVLDIPLPNFRGQGFSLLDLSTHGSGLPTAAVDHITDNDDPYEGWELEELYTWLGSYRLTRAPGSRYEYSNLAVGLLGHALSSRVGQPYHTYLADQVFEPLGMRESWAITGESDAQQRILPKAYDADLEEVRRMTFSEAIVAAGGLVSTAADMERFIRVELALTAHPLAAAVALSQEPHRQYRDGRVSGLGWGIQDNLLNHNGLTNGFTSSLYLDPERGIGVLVLMNIGDFWGLQATIGRAMLDIAAGRQAVAWSHPRRVPFNAETFSSCEGTYTIAQDGESQQVSTGVSANGPWLNLSGRWPLTPSSDTAFVARNYPLEVFCEEPVDGRFRSLRLRHPSGIEYLATRS